MDKKIKINTADPDTISLLYEKYFKVFAAYANSIINNRNSAKDIIQAVFMKLFESDINFENTAHFKGYVYKVISNKCYNHIRDKKQNCELTEAEILSDPEEQIIENDTYSHLYFMIEKLPKVRRKTILMQMQGYSYKDIAEILNSSVETVRSNLKRSKKELKSHMEKLYSLFF